MTPNFTLAELTTTSHRQFDNTPNEVEMANDTELYKAEQAGVSERWDADMSSDSWLSKNIRPMALVAIFVAYFLFALMSAFGYNAQASYVELLGQWGMLVMSAYFGGRTLEKIMEMKAKK